MADQKPPSTGWIERYGEVLLLLFVWLSLSLVGWFASRIPVVRHAITVRAERGIPIKDVKPGQVVRIRGLAEQASFHGSYTHIADDTGAVDVWGAHATEVVDPRLEVIGCAAQALAAPATGGDRPIESITIHPCDDAPLLVGSPATVTAERRRLAHEALAVLGWIVFCVGAFAYVGGRVLGAPLGRRVRGSRAKT